MSKKKDVARKSSSKKTRKVKQNDCPDDVCPIDRKKKSKCCKVSKCSKNCWGSFLDFVFPSRTKR